MAGYIGSKIAVTQVDGYNRTEADAEFVNDPNAVITVSGSNVGIGTSSPAAALSFGNYIPANGQTIHTYHSGNIRSGLGIVSGVHRVFTDSGSVLSFGQVSTTDGSTYNERMRIDSSGNLLVGKTTDNITVVGAQVQADGALLGTRANGQPMTLNRTSSDGDIVQFRKDGSTNGSIRVEDGIISVRSIHPDGYLRFGGASSNHHEMYSGGIYPTVDDVRDLGLASVRFDDVYATNGTIQTSDRNEKQDIEALSDAEQRVAVAAKGLLRKYRWKKAVAEKGDAARIHFGIIAQDLQAAFEAEGLDAGRYAMFISSTWWEADRVIPAVEGKDAVLDDEGNVVEEAVEAQPERTVIDTFNTQDEAPVNATERTRLGVRYPELLAFIIAAL